MKRLAAVLILLLAVSSLSPIILVKARPAHIPHEDPSGAQSTMDAYSFLSQYAGILSLIANEQYDNASKLTAQLSHITVPPDLSYIINRYNNITQQLIGTLSDLRNTLDNATSLLSQNRLSEASQALDNAGVLVARAQILLGDLQDATTTVSQRLGVFAAPAQSNIKQSYDTLQGLLQKLNDLINQYHLLLQSANKQADDIRSKQLDSTQLSLNINPTTAFVGATVTASGVLMGGGQVLRNRVVAILLDGTQVASFNTNSNGQYFAVFTVPYQYVKSMTVQALYAPASNDKETYLACLSIKTSINIQFYQTYLNVTMPNVAYPGLNYIVSGAVTSKNGSTLSQRAVNLLFDDKVVGQIETNQSGLFSIKTILSPQTEVGAHSLTVSVDSEKLYAGASQNSIISVTKLTSKLSFNAPSFVFLPSQLHIFGTATTLSGPLRRALVTLEFANVSDTVSTMDDGSFNSTLNIPLSTIFAGTQSIKVSVQPAESWQASTQKDVSVFVLNSVSTAISLTASLSIIGVLYLRFAKSKPKKNKEKIVQDYFAARESLATNGSGTSIKAEFKFIGLKGEVLEIYIKTLRNIASLTRITINQDMTLREFLKLAELALGNATKPFTDLTLMAERALYSTHIPEEQDLLNAQSCADEIGRTLKNENN